jgi:CHAT domain-containing protein
MRYAFPFLSALLSIAQPAIALAAGPSGAAQPAGTTLNGESCTATPIKDVAGEKGLPAPLALVCGTNSEGSIVHVREPGLVPPGTDVAVRGRIEQRFLQTSAFAALQPQMTCKSAMWITSATANDPPLMALPCTLRDGSWPHLVLVAVIADQFAVADGTPAALPALMMALKSARANDPAAAQQTLIDKIWGHPILLTRGDDMAHLTRVLRAGRTANSAGKFAEAESDFREALDLETGPLKANDQTVASTLLDLALNVSNQGHADEASALFRRATPLVQASSNDLKRARLATYLALNAANGADYHNGLPLARDASQAWRKLADDRRAQAGPAVEGAAPVVTPEEGELANALNIQALMELRNDNLVQAYAAASEALLILNKSDKLPRWWKGDTLVVLGEISVAQGRLSAAETYFNAAIKLRRQLFGDTAPTIRAMAALAAGYQHENMGTSTIVTYREMFRMARALQSSSGIFTADMLVPFASAIVDTAATLTDPVQRRGLYAEAFDAFQLVQSPVVDKTIAQAAARLSAQDPAIARLIGSLQDSQRDIDFARMKLAYQQSLADNERSAQAEADLKAQIAASTASIASTRATLLAKYPSYQQLAMPAAINLDQLRNLLKPHEGVLSFLIGRDRSFAQLVTREGVVIAAVPQGDAAIREAVTSMRRSLEIQGGAINEFNLDEASQLYDLLLGGMKTPLADIDHLVVVPTGGLSNLPFGLLVATPPKGASYQNADWLIRTKTISYTPSLQALSTLRSAQPRTQPRQTLLAFGNPALLGHVGAKVEASSMAALTNNCRQGGPMPASLLLALAPLPDTARELNVVANVLGASPQSLFLGARATEENLRKQSLDDYRVLYFATHGLLPGELHCQAEPGLVLTPPAVTSPDTAHDGLLESSEIAGLRLNADLVVLSACNTAAGDGRFGGGDALSGLAEAFFHAGARNMLVTHWQVPSAATSELMSGLFTTLRASNGGSVSDALRNSQLALIANGQTAHPFFWAAFVVIGDGLGLPVTGSTSVTKR